ncbi:MAG: hypothetical protein DI537_31800 [Stutzerimonas stutzeri]|nr:MAG: hypothetical protein DI537_31800 [Stutzerimonas stutzeri]
MMNTLPITSPKAAFRLRFVPDTRRLAARVARSRLLMVWSVDPAGRLVARWRCDDEMAAPSEDPLGAATQRPPLLRRTTARRSFHMEIRHGRRA